MSGVSTQATDELVVCNGINGATGRSLLSPVPLSVIADIARRGSRITQVPLPDTTRASFDLSALKTRNNLRKVGWGVVFPRGTPAAVKEGLCDLLASRRQEAGPLFQVLDFDPAVDSFRSWLRRHDVGPGDTDFTRVPYYLLLVGPPTQIPFEFQYLLDIEYAVGRVAFEAPAEYASYARSMVEYESGRAAVTAKEIVYWSPCHEEDRATSLSCEQLVRPLIHGDSQKASPARVTGFRTTAFEETAAGKAQLLSVLHRPEGRLPPAVLFTASHGVGWPADDPRQLGSQGALVAQEWSIDEDAEPRHYVAAADIEDSARLHGLIAFSFACFSAGSPDKDSFRERRHLPPEMIARAPFVAALPQRLLAHPSGGALAFIGHVDVAWGFSIRPPGGKRRIGPFRTCIERILRGLRVGLATIELSQRYAVLSAWLASSLDDPDPPTDRELVWSWIERNDAQSYVVLGDPAARLRPSAIE